MEYHDIRSFVKGKTLFLIGIKGTGMATLAVLLARMGASVTGSDVGEQFRTEELLNDAHIGWIESFEAGDMPSDIDMVIHSAAYSKASNAQIARAQEQHTPLYTYPQWLALMSRVMTSYGVAGTHGKTTTSALVQWVVRNTEIPLMAFYGSKVEGLRLPDGPMDSESIALFEACEYQDHFLDYRLDGLLITTIEHDHPDWFASKNEVFDSFARLVSHLPQGAPLVCGVDDPLARRLANHVQAQRNDIRLFTYGSHPLAMVRISEWTEGEGECSYTVSTLDGWFHTKSGSLALACDAVGSALLSTHMVLERSGMLPLDPYGMVESPVFAALLRETETFPGAKGRLERLCVDHDIVFVDDYAHHPTEITVALEALRSQYPSRSLVVVFHPHTVSRTEAFFDGFVESLSLADALVVRPVYASARMDGELEQRMELGRSLAIEAGGMFAETKEEVIDMVTDLLHPGDVCVTMGAGNNSGLALRIAERQRSTQC
jgi:UDP-N-acetylmuramate--alanine ligase